MFSGSTHTADMHSLTYGFCPVISSPLLECGDVMHDCGKGWGVAADGQLTAWVTPLGACSLGRHWVRALCSTAVHERATWLTVVALNYQQAAQTRGPTLSTGTYRTHLADLMHLQQRHWW